MITNFYSCTTIDPSTLYGDDSGVTELQITYKYEIDTSPSTVNIEEAVERVQSAMLHSVAEHSGLADCGVEDIWRRRLSSDDSVGSAGGAIDEDPKRKLNRQTRGRDYSIHRRLRTGGRGSTSIVALSSTPTDTPTNDLCHADAVELATTRVDDTLFDPTIAEVEDGMTGMVVMAEEEEEEEAPANQVDNIEGGGNDQLSANTIGLPSSVTRIDGKVINVLDAAPRSMSRNEGGTGGGEAFNYISTQSLPHEQSSGNLWHTSYNPLRPPKQLSQLLSTRTNNISTASNNGDTENTSLPIVDHSELKETRNTNKKCTVIQGQMRIYTSSSVDPSFENLEDRILDTLIQDVNNKNLGLEGDNLVLDVRMYNSDIPDPIEVSPGYMQAIKGPLNDADSSSSSSFEFTTQMGILASLGCLFLALIALFVHTSRKPRRQSDKEDVKSEVQKTYCDNEVEIDIHDHNLRVVKSRDCNGDFSVGGKYSVRPVDDPILRSSSFWGLFAAKPRAGTPQSEVEVDIEPNVYDCDVPDTPARSTGVSTRGSGSAAKKTPERRTTDDMCDNYSIEAPPYVEKKKKKAEPNYFVGNVTDQGDRIILNSQGGDRRDGEQMDDGRTVFSKTFGRFFARRNRSNDSSNIENPCTIQEIHEIYSANADDRVSRKPTPSPDRTIESFTPSPARTPKTPTTWSPMRPIGFYKSPSELSATRSPRSELGSSPARGKKKSITDMVEVSSESQHEVAKPDPAGCDSTEVQQCAPDVWNDDGSSMMIPANGVMCTGGAIPDCFVSNSWNPFSWAYDD